MAYAVYGESGLVEAAFDWDCVSVAMLALLDMVLTETGSGSFTASGS